MSQNDEFRNSGLLWWTNRILHTFGWAIVAELDDNDSVLSYEMKKVNYLGFDEETDEIKLNQFRKYLYEHLL
jgi:hypothetical protein